MSEEEFENYFTMLGKCKLDENFKIKCKLRVLENNEFKWKEVGNIDKIEIDGCAGVDADVLASGKEVVLYRYPLRFKSLKELEKKTIELGDSGIASNLFDFTIEKTEDGKRIASVSAKEAYPCG